MQKCATLNKLSRERFYKQKLPVIIEVSFEKVAHFPKVPAHTGLTILDCQKKKKKTLKVTKLTSCMNFRMIQAVIKCFEISTVERIKENLNDMSHCLFLYDNANKYGHGEMRDKKLINRGKDITQGWQFSSP